MPSIGRIGISVLLYFAIAPQVATATSKFQSWFPRYEEELSSVVSHNCSSEFAQWSSPEYVTPLWRHSGRAGPLIDCILRATPEIIKQNFNSAAVVLGLMPTLLAMIGPSVQETSTLLAFGDYPSLALLLCLGSPLVGVDRELRIRSSFQALKSKAPSASEFRFERTSWLTFLEYTIALGAIANIAEVTWELAIKTSSTWFKGNGFEIAIWAFVGFITHLLGALTLSTRTQVMVSEAAKAVDSVAPSILNWLRWRFSIKFPSLPAKSTRTARPKQPRTTPVFVHQTPSLTYLLLVGLVAFFTLFQLFFGTIIFSSILFIGVHNAVQVWMRVMSSVIVSRVLVLLELAFVRDVVEIIDSDTKTEANFVYCSTSTQTEKGEV